MKAGIGVGITPRTTVEEGLVIIEGELPSLPQTDTTLFIADNVNEATTLLAQTIKRSPLFQRDSRNGPA